MVPYGRRGTSYREPQTRRVSQACQITPEQRNNHEHFDVSLHDFFYKKCETSSKLSKPFKIFYSRLVMLLGECVMYQFIVATVRSITVAGAGVLLDDDDFMKIKLDLMTGKPMSVAPTVNNLYICRVHNWPYQRVDQPPGSRSSPHFTRFLLPQPAHTNLFRHMNDHELRNLRTARSELQEQAMSD